MTRSTKKKLTLLIGVVCGIALLVGGAFFFRQMQRKSKANQGLDKGMVAYEAGDYDAALQPLSEAAKWYQDDLDLILAFAETRQNVPAEGGSHIGSAMRLYNRALSLDPDNKEALEALLYLYGGVGQLNAVADTANTLLEIEPNHVDAISALASYHYQSREYQQAITQLKKLQDLEPDNVDWFESQLAAMSAMEVPDNELLAQCDAWIETRGNQSMFNYIKANVLVAIGDYDAGRAAAVEAAQSAGNPADVQRRLIQLLDASGEDALVTQLLDEAKTDYEGETWVWEESIKRPWLIRDLWTAAVVVEQAERELGGLDQRLAKWKAFIAAQRNDTETLDAAVARLSELREEAAVESRASMQSWSDGVTAFADFDAGSPSANADVEAIQLAISQNPTDGRLMYLLGRCYRTMNEFDLADKPLREAWLDEQAWIAAGIAYAETLLTLSRPEAAIAVCARLSERWPNGFPVIHLTYARAWLNIAAAEGNLEAISRTSGHDVDSIVDMLEQYRVRTSNEDVPVVLGMLFDAHMLSDNRAAIEKLIEQVLADGESTDESLVQAATVSRELGLLALETRALERLASQSPDTPVGLELRLGQLMSIEQADKGLALIEEARQAAIAEGESDTVEFDMQKAAYLDTIGHPDALDAIRTLLREHSNHARVPMFVLGRASVWQDEALSRAALDAAAEVGSDESIRQRLAEAHWLLTFREDDESRAEAITLVSQVLDRTPDSVAGLALMSRAMMEGNEPDIDEAIDFMRRAIDLYPSRVDLYPRLISLYQKKGDIPAATSLLDQLGRRENLPDSVRQEEIRLLQQQNNVDEAIVRMSSQSLEGMEEAEQIELASLLVRSGQHDKAEDILTPLAMRDDPNEDAVISLAELYSLTDRFDEGVTLLSAGDDEDVRARSRLARFYLNFGRHGLALQEFQAASRLEPKNPDHINGIVSSLLQLGRFDEARSVARQGLEIDPDHNGLVPNFALASFSADAAILDEAIEMVRGLGDEHQALADTLTLIRDTAGKRPTGDSLRDATRLTVDHSDFLPGWRFAVDQHVQAGVLEEAGMLAREAMTRFPIEAAPAEWLTAIMTRLGRPSEAIVAAKEWRKRRRHSPMQPDMAIASILVELDRADEAMAHIEPHIDRVFANDPQPDVASYTIVQTLVANGNVQRAAALVEPYFTDQSAWRDAWLQLATNAPVEESAEMLNVVAPDMLAEETGSLGAAAAWMQLGKRSGNESHLDRAESFANQAFEGESTRTDALLMLGAIADLRNHFDESEKFYRDALARQPEHPVAMNNLAYVLLRTDRSLEEADKLSARTVELHPTIHAFLDTRALVLLKLDKAREAESFARQAIQLDGSDATYHLTLARSLLKQSKFDEAQFTVEQAERLIDTTSAAQENLPGEIDALRGQIREAQSMAMTNDSEGSN